MTLDKQDCHNCAQKSYCEWQGAGWCTMWADENPPTIIYTDNTQAADEVGDE